MNIINAAFVRNGATIRTLPVYQYNRGMILNISGLDDLPSTFRADFANTETGQSKTVIGTNGEVHVPYEYFVPGATIHCWLVWSGEDYTVTRKHIMIPVARRATPTDEEPTPDEQGVIDQAIAALNDAVAQTGQDVESAAGYAEQAGQSAQAATDVKDAAVTAKADAEAAKDRAVESAAGAATSAQSASESAQSASQSKTAAQEAAASVSAAMDSLEATIQADLQAAKESGEFDGADGVSPTVTVTPVIGGHQVMITDAEGEHTFDVTNGEPGADGFSPVATVTQTQTGATISITDKAGTTTAQISNGQDGEPGADGVTFTPAVSSEGVISWTNNGGKTNPQPVNIKGPKGDPGEVTQTEFDDLADDVSELKSHLYGSSTTNYTEGKNLTATSVSHAVIDDPNACISELIPLSWGTSAYANYFFTDDVSDSNSYYVFFYDADEQYLDWSKRQANTTYRGIKAPANTAYAQFSFKKGFSAYVGNNTNPPTTIYWTAQASAGGGIISDIGDLSDLNTTDKQSLVNAINEVNNKDSASEYFELVDGQNLLNQSDTDFVTGGFLNTNGSVSEYSGYNISGYIAVNEGDKLIGSYSRPTGSGSIEFRTVACYGSNKVVLSNKGVYSVSQFVVPSGVAFVRICYGTGSYGNVVQICKTDSNYFKPYKPYEEPHYEIKEEYLPTGEAPLHVLLPSDIYVAVGRTIELYNKQIVLDYENYYFRWVCNIGSAYERKFSVTGTTVGSYNLQLYIYDKYMNVCWVGLCIIHVVAASNPVKKILPIGDSLTRGKAWLTEVMLLSSNNVEWLGTRYSNNLKDSENNTYAKVNHEGRSGWSAGNYLTDSVYDQDTAYDGVPGVDGSANPFWDGTKFSLEHYLTTQTGVPTPDAVQIFLGTNDLTVSVENAAENITAMVTSIRSEYPSLPIFVCNTIFRSNQNGYSSTGSDAYAGGGGANSWQYDQDARVMGLMVGLRASLANVTGVYFIPLASCMDREYDFGQVMTKVNPRSTVEVPMPSESVHPQAPGYYQMADLMYSFYCGILAE